MPRRKSIRLKMKQVRAAKAKQTSGETAECVYPPMDNGTMAVSSSSVVNESANNVSSAPSRLKHIESTAVHLDNAVPSTSHCTFSIGEQHPVTALSSLYETPQSITGRRIVDVLRFFTDITRFEHHHLFNCDNRSLELISEERKGLESRFLVKCRMCFVSKLVNTDPDDDCMSINKAIVLGSIVTGSGYSQMQELFSTADIPFMGNKLYIKTENQLASYIQEIAWESMERVAKEEAQIAIEEGRVDSDGIPMITVVVDGAWCKRSYKVNYNASSGIGVIIGYKTGKLLFVGVRNKYCCICARANSDKTDSSPHKCFKNWDKPSTAMEADIIVEGFMKSVELYNLKYVYMVGDGDSSVLKRLHCARPYGSRVVQKIECRNHILRNFCTKLRELTTKRLSLRKIVVPVAQRNVVNNNIRRLRCGIQQAVQHYISQTELSHSVKVQQLRKDILNAPRHVFGEHSLCSMYFCKGPKTVNEKNWVPEMNASGLFQEISIVTDRVARNSESLLINMDTNMAERYNSVLNKFIGGKRVNYAGRRSYQTRSEAAACSFNLLPGQLPSSVHRKDTNTSPGNYTKKFMQKKTNLSRWKRAKRQLFTNRKKRKGTSYASADEEYGALTGEMPLEEYKDREKELLNSLTVTEDQIKVIQIQTIGQSNNLLWRQERTTRLTASNFGVICKQRKVTHCHNLIKRLLYSTFEGNMATRWGRDHEILAIRDFQDKFHVHVKECGLFIDSEYHFLAASPDGLIDDDGIIEIKCPQKASSLTVVDAIHQQKITFAKFVNGQLQLKRNNNYYYQIQGQLQITNRNYCIFVVWTPFGLEIEKINKDDEFWRNKMKEPLVTFFYKCLLPELIDPQIPRGCKTKDLRQ